MTTQNDDLEKILKEEVTHEDVKAFMNEPEEEAPKAPPPLMVDDFAPMEQQDGSLFKGRLTTEKLATVAFEAAVATIVEVETESSATLAFMETSPQHRVQWANFIINSAANPNGYEVCRELYENLVMEKRENYVYLIPFSKLSPQEKLPWFVFRSMIVTMLSVWTGH